jgi:hypothetical protein
MAPGASSTNASDLSLAAAQGLSAQGCADRLNFIAQTGIGGKRAAIHTQSGITVEWSRPPSGHPIAPNEEATMKPRIPARFLGKF